MLKVLRMICLAGTSVVLAAGTSAVVWAASTGSTDSIAHSYGTDGAVRQGMIVGLQAGSTTKVVALSRDRASTMLGVAISATDAPITISGETSSAQVYVATSGQYKVLVSNQNGPIRAGDDIAVSSLNGVGMKAQVDDQVVLGKAVADFTGAQSRETSTATLKDNGGSTTVVIGVVPVDLSVGNNPHRGTGNGNLPGFLQIATSNIASKQVAASRVYLSLAVLFVTTLIAGSLIYSGVRSGLTSIGRNPLAKRSILRGLLQVILVSVIIFILGLFAVYLLLRL